MNAVLKPRKGQGKGHMRVLQSDRAHGIASVLATDEKGKEARYDVQVCTTGKAYLVVKLDDDGATLAMHITSPARGTCDCEGRGHGYQCRHLDMVSALIGKEIL